MLECAAIYCIDIKKGGKVEDFEVVEQDKGQVFLHSSFISYCLVGRKTYKRSYKIKKTIKINAIIKKQSILIDNIKIVISIKEFDLV